MCFVGAEDRLFRPGWQPEAPFHVLFVGKLIPLHGLETILAAAALAPEIPFRVVGSGQLERAARRAARRTSSGCRGSSTRSCRARSRPRAARSASSAPAPKAARVIPNKAFQALACGTPLVTADTPAARELLTDGAMRSSSRRATPRRSPRAIRRLAGDPRAAPTGSARPAARHTRRVASEDVLGARWRALLERAIAAA